MKFLAFYSTGWAEFDGDMSVKDVARSASEVTILFGDGQNKRHLFMSEQNVDLKTIDKSFNDWIAEVTFEAFVSHEGWLKIVNRKLLFADIDYLRLPRQAWHPEFSVGTDLPSEMYKDILIPSSGVRTDLLKNRVVFSVGGLLHRTNHTSVGIQIVDACNTIRNTSDAIGVISFEQFKEDIAFLELTEVNMTIQRTKQASEQHDTFKVIVSTEYDLDEVSPLISIAGFLHTPGATFKKMGDNTLLIDLDYLDWPKRVLEYVKYSGTDVGLGDGSYTHEDFYNEEMIFKILTASHSFIMLLPNKNWYYKEEVLEPTGIVNSRFVREIRDLPIMSRDRRLLSYLRFDRTIRFPLPQIPNFKYLTWNGCQDSFDDTVDPNVPYLPTDIRMLEMGASQLEPIETQIENIDISLDTDGTDGEMNLLLQTIDETLDAVFDHFGEVVPDVIDDTKYPLGWKPKMYDD